METIQRPECTTQLTVIETRLEGIEQTQERHIQLLTTLGNERAAHDERLKTIEAYQAKQNGILTKVSDSLVSILQQITELRTHSMDIEAETVRYRELREQHEKELAKAKADAEPTTNVGFIARIARQHPVSFGIVVGLILATMIWIGRDAWVAWLAK